MPEMNYSAIYFLMEKSMDWVHGAVDQIHGCGPRGRGARGALRPSVYASAAEILWIEGVRGDLISTIPSRTNDQDGAAVLDCDWRDIHGGGRGGSLELGLPLTLVAHPPLGLQLRDLQRMRFSPRSSRVSVKSGVG
jgi:hypothetical protein